VLRDEPWIRGFAAIALAHLGGAGVDGRNAGRRHA
jgi:hypothetical protein